MSRLFDFAEMDARRSAYYAFVRANAGRFFKPDGAYKPEVDPDQRSTFWSFPAMIETSDEAERRFALGFYAGSPAWNHWDIFVTSSIAANLVRERDRLTPELIARSEDHLDRFCSVQGGRKPCSAANDYMFHGYNDNMPAMAARALVLAGDVLERADLSDRGVFLLEGLCAHFQRRGLTSEYNSGTYTPINLTALMDIAECSRNEQAAGMALACTRRIVLDFLAHWNRALAAPVGSASRAYLADAAATMTNWNMLAWYVSGDSRLIDPMQALAADTAYDGPVHHGPNQGFMIAQMCEFLSPSYRAIGDDIVAFANREQDYPRQVLATTDSGRTNAIQTRAWSTPRWGLGTASAEMWAGQSGQHMVLSGVVAAGYPVRSWRDRLGFWQCLQEGAVDIGDKTPSYGGQSDECSCVHDHGAYHTLQQRGTAMLLGHAGTSLLGREVSDMKMILAFGTRGRMPEECAVGSERLQAWEGESPGGAWHFMRFGDAFLGVRAAGMLQERALPVERSLTNGYLRIELPILRSSPTTVDQEFRKWLDIGILVEMADAEECGSFERFMSQCMAGTWEFGHCFYRNSRYAGRNGELHVIDSIEPDAVRFRAIDGQVEQETFFEATGMHPSLLTLFPDQRQVRKRRLWYDPSYIGTPFYPLREHVIVMDAELE